MTTRETTVKSIARELAIHDAKVCAANADEGIKMDGEWSGAHTDALAERLDCVARELTDDDLRWAEEAYAAEAMRH